ncbi:endonuclease [Kushneria sp. Sum13]|uniref:endonuclease n=1 Tax=Kushneria sp. Sum13 TaxID=3459196 RepID=UPI0040452AF9
MYRLVLSLLLIIALPALAEPPGSFSTAKKIATQIHADHQRTFYCDCTYTEDGPDLASCGYQVRKQKPRANRIEWEHIMPAYDFGRQRQCWQDGGRRNCRSNDPVFRRAEADLVNLVPSVGEVNGDRSNMRYGMVTSADAYQYGQCSAKVSFKERTFQPPAEVRGNIARTYWYMRDTYGTSISSQQQRLFEAWAKADPVDDWERLRNQRITAIQGSGNPYVEDSPQPQPLPTPAANDPVLDQASSFSCETRKTCSMMRSCDEAVYHLQQCGNTRLDGDKDGVPCESLCR